MVIALALYPLAVVAGIALLDRLAPVGLVALITSSSAFNAALCAVVLAAVLAASLRHRGRTVLMSAWLFFFCGALILALGYLVEPFVPEDASWVEELFETVAFFPLVIFVAYVASPLRIVMLSRARRRLYTVLGIVLLVGVAAVVFLPWALAREGPRLHSSAENLMHLAQTVLDIILLEPIILVLLVIGLSQGSRAYFLVAVGLLILLPEDIVGSFRDLRLWDLYGQYSHLLFVGSQLYILNGALLGALERRRKEPADPG